MDAVTDKAAEIAKRPWTHERTARLGFLVGLGWDVKRIAEDPIIASNANNVYRTAHRFGLSFLEANSDSLRIKLPLYAREHFAEAGAKREMTCEQLLEYLLQEIADDRNLLPNILDDGIQ